MVMKPHAASEDAHNLPAFFPLQTILRTGLIVIIFNLLTKFLGHLIAPNSILGL